MDRKLLITYYHHSGFSVSDGDILLVFDYWCGDHNQIRTGQGITPDILRKYRKVFVFITHEHPDHMDPIVFQWKSVTDVSYIMSAGMFKPDAGDLPCPIPDDILPHPMAPGEAYTAAGNLKVWAFGSTDLGVSYLVDFNGIMLFHAGDLNFWHWRDESTVAEIEQADTDFRREVAPLTQYEIDVAFFPVDPRQGQMYDAGANYFLMTVKPRLMIPMHFWGRGDLMQEFARRSRSNISEIIPLTRLGDKMLVVLNDQNEMNVTTALPEISVDGGMRIHPQPHSSNRDLATADMAEGDPFLESDLPVDLEMLIPRKDDGDSPAQEPEA